MRVMPLALITLAAVSGPSASRAAPQFFGPSPYHSVLDSPFHYIPHNYFYVEDCEDNAINTPGLSVTGGMIFGPSTSTDSVDGDDGHIDGTCTSGHSYWSAYFINGITFTFNATTLGNLPTMAGVVWTDVGQVGSGTTGYGNVVFEAFDQNGVSLGTIGPTPVGDGLLTGECAEDRFLGVENLGGISKIRISMTNSYDYELDHVQYGFTEVTGVAGNTPKLRVGEAFPNPSPDGVTIAASGGDDALRARVYDVSGALMRTLASADHTRLVWDGRDEHGARVPSGIYFIDVRDRAAEARRRVSIVH